MSTTRGFETADEGCPSVAMAVWPAVIATMFLAMLRAPWPDGWDGIGFVLAVRDFDLAAFRPHFPGYPVYVALSRMLTVCSASDSLAASLASCVGGGLLVLGVGGCIAPSRASSWTPLALIASPLIALTATSVGSDALGVGLIAVAVACMTRCSRSGLWASCAGATTGLALGARPSNVLAVCIALLIAAIAPKREPLTRTAMQRAMIFGVVGFAIAVIPTLATLVFTHGIDVLVRLGRAQIGGHFAEWGGTAATDANLASRVVRLCRAVLFEGLGVAWTPAGVLRGTVIALLVVRGAMAAAKRVWFGALAGVMLLALYTVLAQNVGQPRHSLPIVCAVMAFAVHGLSATIGSGPRVSMLAAAIALAAIAYPTAELLALHRRESPPGLAAARWIRDQGETRDALLFGGRAARFGEIAGVRSLPRTWMGEIEVTLERLDRLPPRIYLTDEVQFRERARGRMAWQRTFCRDARLEVGAPCVAIYRYDPVP